MPKTVRMLRNPQIELVIIERVGEKMALLTDINRTEWYSAELMVKEGIWYAASVNGYGDRWTALTNATERSEESWTR